MAPFRDREIFWWVLAAVVVTVLAVAHECLGDELPPYPSGFEIEDEYGRAHHCFDLDEEKILARAYASAYFCERDRKVLDELSIEQEVENQLLNRRLEIVQSQADEHAKHAEAVELLLKEASHDTRRARLKDMTKTVLIVVLGVAVAGLGGALVYEQIDD